MRFEWHTVILIPIISQLPSARLTLGCWHWSLLALLCRTLELSISSRQPFCSLKGQCSSEQPDSISQSSPVSDDRVLLLRCGCHTDSVSPGWCSLWGVCGGVWWNPAVLGAKPDWQWTLAASPENNIIFVRTLNCILVTVSKKKKKKRVLCTINMYCSYAYMVSYRKYAYAGLWYAVLFSSV